MDIMTYNLIFPKFLLHQIMVFQTFYHVNFFKDSYSDSLILLFFNRFLLNS
jgi:hypothetical protein